MNQPSHPEGHPHVVSIRILAGVLGALLVLTWMTVAATWVDLGIWNLWIAMGVATIKGSLVVLYFMHLRWDRPVNALFFIGALVFVMLFVGLVLMDTTHYQDDILGALSGIGTPIAQG